MKKVKNPITVAIENAITKNHSGKMSGMWSLSTSSLKNALCILRSKCESIICHYCYSNALQKQRSNLAKKLIRNTELLTSEIYPINDMPKLNIKYFRLESFGDLINTIQVVNYFNLCKANKDTRFALWTKNPWIIKNAMKFYGIKKPSNLNIVYSINAVDIPETDLNRLISKFDEVYGFIDKYFAVYSSKAINDQKITINCGALHCLSCLKCYKKNKIRIIREKKK